MQFCLMFTFVLLFCYEMFMLDVMFLHHSIMMSQSKAPHLINAHLTISNLSALANQNTFYKTIALKYLFYHKFFLYFQQKLGGRGT